MCWVGQKTHLDFSVTAYGQTRMNFLANPIFCFIQSLIQPYEILQFPSYKGRNKKGEIN